MPRRFQSTLPVGGATALFSPKPAKTVISIHAPRGGSDQAEWHQAHIGCYFNPRSPWGERLPIDQLLALKKIISIHAPRGGSDQAAYNRRHRTWYFNPRSPWGERLLGTAYSYALNVISIHAPRGGSDCWGRRERCGDFISIHAPRGGSDKVAGFLSAYSTNFNPRSPWGERQGWIPCQRATKYFNPRSPWGERHYQFDV